MDRRLLIWRSLVEQSVLAVGAQWLTARCLQRIIPPKILLPRVVQLCLWIEICTLGRISMATCPDLILELSSQIHLAKVESVERVSAGSRRNGLRNPLVLNRILIKDQKLGVHFFALLEEDAVPLLIKATEVWVQLQLECMVITALLWCCIVHWCWMCHRVLELHLCASRGKPLLCEHHLRARWRPSLSRFCPCVTLLLGVRCSYFELHFKFIALIR